MSTGDTRTWCLWSDHDPSTGSIARTSFGSCPGGWGTPPDVWASRSLRRVWRSAAARRPRSPASGLPSPPAQRRSCNKVTKSSWKWETKASKREAFNVSFIPFQKLYRQRGTISNFSGQRKKVLSAPSRTNTGLTVEVTKKVIQLLFESWVSSSSWAWPDTFIIEGSHVGNQFLSITKFRTKNTINGCLCTFVPESFSCNTL